MNDPNVQSLMQEIQRLREENARLKAQIGQTRPDGKMTQAQWDQEKQYQTPDQWKAADAKATAWESAKQRGRESFEAAQRAQDMERLIRDRMLRPGAASPSAGPAST